MFKLGKKKEEERKIPTKNYILLAVILVITMVLGIYLYNIFVESDTNNPLMDDYLAVINYNELGDYVTENKDVVVYVSVLGNADIRSFEKEFRHVVNRYELNDQILYLDLTNCSNEIKVKLSNLYNLDGRTIADIPCLLIFKNGLLVDIYNLKDDYNIDKLVNYLQQKEVIEND